VPILRNVTDPGFDEILRSSTGYVSPPDDDSAAGRVA
jgi:hypothetical protein